MVIQILTETPTKSKKTQNNAMTNSNSPETKKDIVIILWLPALLSKVNITPLFVPQSDFDGVWTVGPRGPGRLGLGGKLQWTIALMFVYA